MQKEIAEVSIFADFDHGEGVLDFTWNDSSGIKRSLIITLDAHCSREMPIRSGSGWPDINLVDRSRVVVTFPEELAKKLELECVVEFATELDDTTFRTLQDWIRCVEGEELD